VIKIKKDDYISLTAIAKSKEGDFRAADIIKNWIRNRGTIEFIGTWEEIHNPDFKVVEFDHFRMNAISRMKILVENHSVKMLDNETDGEDQ